jgi:hypothetical protein
MRTTTTTTPTKANRSPFKMLLVVYSENSLLCREDEQNENKK